MRESREGEHLRLPREGGYAVDEACQLHNLLDLVQIPQLRYKNIKEHNKTRLHCDRRKTRTLQGSDDVDGDEAGKLRAFLCCDIPSNSANKHWSISRLRKVSSCRARGDSQIEHVRKWPSGGIPESSDI